MTIVCSDSEVTWENPNTGDQPYAHVTGLTFQDACKWALDRSNPYRKVVRIERLPEGYAARRNAPKREG